MDLAQVEGLADLVMAETEMQRRAAIGLAGGSLSQEVEGWLARLLALSAQVEAVLVAHHGPFTWHRTHDRPPNRCRQRGVTDEPDLLWPLEP